MQKRLRFLPLLLAAACMLGAVLYAAAVKQEALLSQVRFSIGAQELPLRPHYDEEEQTCFLFLPAFADAADVTIHCPAGVEAAFSSEAGNYDGLGDIPLSEEVTLTLSAPLHRQTYAFRLMKTSAKTSLHIQGEDGLLPYLHADKQNSRDVSLTVAAEGEIFDFGRPALSGRGNGSWEGTSKRPYNLTFSQPVNMGPFQDITKLCLLAEFSDESKLRNSLAYYAGQMLEIPYASAYEYVDLYVNGDYMGLYGVVTKEEYKKHLESDGIQAVFEITSGRNALQFTSSLGWEINVLQGSLSQVRTQINALEAALTAQDWDACGRILDIDSFALKYAMEEFLANLDLSYASQYFYINSHGKIQCMLPWDYDWTLGSSFSYFNNRQVYELKVLRSENAWYCRLLDWDSFREKTADILEGRFTDDLFRALDDHLLQSIDTISGSWECDRLRWRSSPAYNQYDLRSGVTSLEEFRVLYCDYFPRRREFLTDYLRSPEDYCRILFLGTRWGNLHIPRGAKLADYLTGATLVEVANPGERFLGWADWEGVPPEDYDRVTEDLVFYSRYEELSPEGAAAHPLMEFFRQHWLKVAVCGAFGLTALAVFAAAFLPLRPKTRPGSRRQEQEV